MIELTTLMLDFCCSASAGFVWEAVALFADQFLVALLYIDLEHFILPNELVQWLAVLARIQGIITAGR